MKNFFIMQTILLVTLTTAMAQKNPNNIQVEWNTDTSNRLVPLEEFTTLLQPDGIPPIDDPVFWDREKAAEVYFSHEPVIALEINNQAKAYPLSILTFHEIVNDKLAGTPVTVSYCPLCNAAIVFDRNLTFKGNQYLLDFGVSGMLRNSDLVMWDRQTESWWQQFTGKALVGELAGAYLEPVSSMIISLEEFFASYPDGRVLSTETGHTREYGTNPYTGYDNPANTRPRLFDGAVDSRLPAMERVVDVHVGGEYKIYPLSVISSEGVINDTFREQPLVLFHTTKTVSVLDEKEIAESRKVGSVTVFVPEVNDRVLTFTKTENGFKDRETGSLWNITGKCISGPLEGNELWPVTHGNHFAFAFLTFHPDSEIYRTD